ncbi:uncharacterized protein LOC133716304 [Rosa rugosa]|uniref:uncharacterized protein LOC133716304 n=1 Tax=Rosa rugosa TaxID=74645 RepID=UPI002B413D98|nr:uncharacterized protein LOC133716304 [Rosa rugosa]
MARTGLLPLHAITNTSVSEMKRFTGTINGSMIKVFVDCRSAMNFLNLDVASRLGLKTGEAPPLRFTTATSELVSTSQQAFDVLVTIQGYLFKSSFLLLLVPGCDLLLGTPWLDSLGFVGWLFLEKLMVFMANGCRQVLQGITKKHRAVDHNSFMALMTQEHLDPNSNHLGPHVPPATTHGHEVQQLITNYGDLFVTPTGLPQVRPIDHRISLRPTGHEVNVCPYRYSHSQKAKLESQVKEMLSNGLICPSHSPFFSPVLLVIKKKGRWRFCIDYRELNTITSKDRFSIPVIDELLNKLHGAKFFSKLDLRVGYHQIRMCEDDIHKTAFHTHGGHYEFMVMPFLIYASSTCV